MPRSIVPLMKTTKLGAHGPHVSAVGLGSLSMGNAGPFGASRDEDAIRTIHEAIDRGVTLIDTADFYAMGANELLVGRALASRRRDDVVLSVKFGAMCEPSGRMVGLDARPAAVKNFAAYSLRRLGIDVIDVYRPARLDPNVPVEDTVGAISDLIKAGYVRYVGLSEVSAETIRRAHAVHPIADVQMEYSLATRAPEDKIKHNNLICVTDRRNTVADNNIGASGAKRLQPLQDRLFCLGINR